MASKDDDIYKEFSDVDFSHWPYVTCESATKEMRRLAAEHKLGFMFNPGGGEYYCGVWRCQITACDDVMDLNALRAALRINHE